MLSENVIQYALNARRVVPLPVSNPHGSLGLEHLAAEVSRVNPMLGSGDARVRRPIALDQATWEKLAQLAAIAMRTTSQHVTTSQLAAAIIEQFLAALPHRGEAEE